MLICKTPQNVPCLCEAKRINDLLDASVDAVLKQHNCSCDQSGNVCSSCGRGLITQEEYDADWLKNSRPYLIVDGEVGPFRSELIESWRSSSAGDKCVHCGSILEIGWCGVECPGCDRTYQVALGCRCNGTVKCPGSKEKEYCTIDCEICGGDNLCPVCCPDS